MKCDAYIRNELRAHVVLSGATTIFQGIVEHMTKERTALVPLSRDLQEARRPLPFRFHFLEQKFVLFLIIHLMQCRGSDKRDQAWRERRIFHIAAVDARVDVEDDETEKFTSGGVTTAPEDA